MLKRCLTGAGRLQECKNTEFVWKFRKMGFCQGGRKKSCLLTSVPLENFHCMSFVHFFFPSSGARNK